MNDFIIILTFACLVWWLISKLPWHPHPPQPSPYPDWDYRPISAAQVADLKSYCEIIE